VYVRLALGITRHYALTEENYADGKEDREALQIRGCFAGSEGIADLAVAYKDYINPCVSPRLAKNMPNPFIDDSL
ncbi:hypothetical protein L249_7100, partial [Ophiocordyceps polyrhachis-furcata BCC 54312]